MILLIKGECLIIQSSSKVMFLLRKYDELTKLENWEVFKTMKCRGAIYYMKDTNRMQITTYECIYFYLINMETYEPKLENVMNNYMSCA
jgi:hypothetical protein